MRPRGRRSARLVALRGADVQRVLARGGEATLLPFMRDNLAAGLLVATSSRGGSIHRVTSASVCSDQWTCLAISALVIPLFETRAALSRHPLPGHRISWHEERIGRSPRAFHNRVVGDRAVSLTRRVEQLRQQLMQLRSRDVQARAFDAAA